MNQLQRLGLLMCICSMALLAAIFVLGNGTIAEAYYLDGENISPIGPILGLFIGGIAFMRGK